MVSTTNSVLEKKGIMNRERALKVVLVLVGLLFTAGIYPLVGSIRDTWQTNKESAAWVAVRTGCDQGLHSCITLRLRI